MTRPTRPVGRVRYLLLFPVLLACEESTLPTIPDSEPRFTAVAINSVDALPRQNGTVQPGSLQYSITVYYQMAPDWQDEDLDMWLWVSSYVNDVLIAFEHVDVLPVSGSSGTLRFQGTMTVPNCGSIDELFFFTGLWPSDDDPAVYANSDGYVVDVLNASSQPCAT